MSPEALGLMLGIGGGVVTWYVWRAFEKRRPESTETTQTRITDDERRELADLEAKYAKEQKHR